MAYDQPLTLDERVALFKKQSVFEHWPDQQLYNLAQRAEEILFENGSNIVKEGELVDRLYFLINGRAEVCVFVIRGEGMHREVIATLGPGESIGLSESSLFSRSGVRTATVTCLSDQRVLSFRVDFLNEILKAHPELNQQMQIATEMIVRMNFIKQLNPFRTLLPEDLRWLANQIEEIHVPKNTVIFRQGEIGDHCYFIKSGMVKVTVAEDTEIHELARLAEKQIFGEVSVMLESPRTATVTTLMECVLFRVTAAQLDHLNEYDDDSFKTMMGLVIERARPRKSERVEISARIQESGERQYVLKDEAHNRYFELSEVGLMVWNLINGSTAMREIVRKAQTRKPELTQTAIERLLFRLVSAGFVEVKGLNIRLTDEEQNIAAQSSGWFKQLFEKNISFLHADSSISFLYRTLFHFFYTPIGVLLLIPLIGVGMMKFVALTQSIATLIFSMPISQIIAALLLMNVASIFTQIGHELSHALTTKHFGYKIRTFGIGWYHWGPLAFCDTSDAWAALSRERKWINFSGMIGDILIASFFALMVSYAHSDFSKLCIWFLIVRSFISVVISLNVLVERDGYYVLSDLLAEPHLRDKAMVWLTRASKTKAARRNLRACKHEIIFWLWSVSWIFLSACFGWFLQQYILVPHFMILGKPEWSWLGFTIFFVIALCFLCNIVKHYKVPT